MPEGVEIEIYRRAALVLVGRQVAEVHTPDAWYLKEGTTAEDVAQVSIGATIEGVERTGKLMLLVLSSGHHLGLRFGMTGRLIVDAVAAIDYLEYASRRDVPEWERFGLRMIDGGGLSIRDPRRLGGVIVDPDTSRLGVDAFGIAREDLRARVLVGSVALKARLLDQTRIAGVGNLIADETLWRAGLDPSRAAGSLTEHEAEALASALVEVTTEFLANGGSHTGQLMVARHRGASCPRCGEPIARATVGGRTTYWCPREQQ